ncbi:flagellar basal-body MS-ring/collar protein FliF [Sphingomonas sp.]|jgi:flagellar M-ring protein FliF|uniref:flagellar basal-body MS-ring/collar protein FliF n=1 Tax=Sphingomonas sp. TaxID=28214 RepID=UPI002E33C711|nr:flagellar basal-body MS-ring/collar protein FliF [Sphingomonas sp.]HEX4694593.1 flagellar basal-body MS-ring/collar protein FliF [Sphingomonas sp.]
MSNTLTPLPVEGNPGFANPVKQLTGLLAQPAVKRSLPMIFMVGLIASAALAWFMLSTPTQKTLFSGLPDSDKAAVISALKTGGITGRLDDSTDAVTVAESDYSKARMLLAGQGLPKSAPAGYAILDNLPMGTSRAVEGERLRQARESELARSIEDIDAVAEARVHLAVPENTVFVRDNAAPSASVILKLQGGRSLSNAQVASIVNLVASSVPGMKPESVTIVDQMGALLSKPDGADGGNDARVRLQTQVEQKYRDQLTQLLTPLVGVGNFTAEVSADVNLDDTSSTRESYDKSGALRAEQGNWTGKDGGAAAAPGGIPGALSNTPAGPTTVTAPNAQPVPPPAAGAAAAPGAPVATPAPSVPDGAKAADSYARAYDLGKEVSVTRNAPGGLKRLSVAVVLRDVEGSKPRTPVEMQQLTQLVSSAVGSDTSRGDQVTVISRRFAPAALTDGGPKFYESGWFAMIMRNVTALGIALLVLFLGVRPLAKALLKKRDDAGRGRDLAALGIGAPIGNPRGQAKGPVGIDALGDAQNFDDRLGTVRGFTRDNPARAALAVRDMIKADAR